MITNQIMEQQREPFATATSESAEHFFLMCHQTVDNYLDREMLKHVLVQRTLETVVHPALDSRLEPQPYVARAMATLTEMPNEKFESERMLYETNLEQIEKIEKCYCSIASPQ